jgi:hypothetical protein
MAGLFLALLAVTATVAIHPVIDVTLFETRLGKD